MIIYTAKDLIKRARQLADLENSSFISWNEQINLLNENYVALYQKLCNIGDKSFLKTFHCGAGETELPSDFWQLKAVSQNISGNLIPVLRRADSAGFNYNYYDIRNGKIIIGGNSGTYDVDYFPQPETLVFKPESVAIEEDVVNNSNIICAYDKVLLLSDGSIYDLETQASIGSFANFSQSDAVVIMDDSNILACPSGAFYNYVTNTLYELDFSTKGNCAVVYDGTIYPAVYDRDTNVVTIKTGLNSSCPIVKTFEYDCPNGTYPSVIWTNRNCDDVWCYSSFTTMKLYHNQDEIDFTPAALTNVVLNNSLCYIKRCNYAYPIAGFRVYNSDNEFKEITLKGVCGAINKIDYDTGYGFTVKRFGKYYIDSFLEDTILNFPNSFYYNILSYYLAIAFKLKQGGDVSGLSSLLAQQEQTFFDTMTNDDCGPVRITNVY